MKRILSLVASFLCLVSVWMVSSSFTIHLMGDSTMAEKDLKKAGEERGWGMMFQNFLDPGAVKVINYAQNGRSTKSFRTLGLWQKVYDAVRPGDYVFIQFGHNDAKESDSTRYAAPFGAYQDNLRLFIDGVREKGGTPVLLTPVARRWFKEGGLDRNCHTDYPAAMKAVASEKNVTLLDVTTPTLDWIEGLGDEASKAYFMISTGKNHFDLLYYGSSGLEIETRADGLVKANAHVVGDCEEQGGHAAGLVDHDHGPSDVHELSEGVADLALVLPDLRVQQNFARSPVDRREVMRPLAHVDPAADIELSFHSAPFVREELAFGHGTNHGITLREQAAPSAPRHQPIGYQSAPANPAA